MDNSIRVFDRANIPEKVAADIEPLQRIQAPDIIHTLHFDRMSLCL